MFTGLIEATGKVLAVTPTPGATRITVAAPTLAPRLNTGDSIAVSGVCLTALSITDTEFSADLAAETIARTTLSNLTPGSTVNLELPTPAGSPLGGHVVQGHVDGTATLIALEPITPDAPDTDWRLRLRIPESLTRYVVPQGSITIEGITLTTHYNGGAFSLDGVHPSDTGHAIFANAFIAAANKAYGLSIPAISSSQIVQIFNADPFIDFGGNGVVAGRPFTGLLETLGPFLGISGGKSGPTSKPTAAGFMQQYYLAKGENPNRPFTRQDVINAVKDALGVRY